MTIKDIQKSDCAARNPHLLNPCNFTELKPGKNKYGAKKVIHDGIEFDSQKEGGRYLALKMMERAGLITELKLQPKFLLIEKMKGQRKCEYTADFQYVQDGVTVVEDVKGFKNSTFRLK